MRRIRKALDTLRMTSALVCARHFGRYVISTYAGRYGYHEYEWRGRRWAFPSGPLDDDT